MSEQITKPNYNDSQYNPGQYKNTFGDAPSYLPTNYQYDRSRTDSFYNQDDSSGTGSFLFGALVGGVIGAAAALFLAPKTGSEMREDFSSQAGQLKDKSIELSSVAKQKATELTTVAKEKTGELTKTIQEQSGQLVDKVKTMSSKTSAPMDDGTVSSEGEEAIDYVQSTLEKGKEVATSTGEALKEAVVKKMEETDQQKTGNSDVAYDNSENFGKEKITNQNHISVEEPK
ncbi:YtxH domain-containing protein [Sporosarcina sp. 179-K 3D1 HS]|uniref:YtxH domain-containing protein n=1 Tax=Sporosarcina sp. 179-K 3D1 HS TaxID=3232169 RepID=UPI0039A062CA